VLPTHHETELGGDDVYFTHWQGGGGYGDPLLRDPAAVAADLLAHKVSPAGVADVYGVVLTADGTVDTEATGTRRTALRRSRAGLDEDCQEATA
jgi:N-methylhydantoinase B